ncbi:MAG: hypothetical protein K8U57_04360 [Planctomycetes bacterium]|nr:hypothetical protein [Planctomycetota bacterium]
MSLRSRLKMLDVAMPKCKPGIMWLARPDHVPSEPDRCQRCGGCHVLVIEEVIVESREQAELYLAKNGELS